jgi:hypothetical protein
MCAVDPLQVLKRPEAVAIQCLAPSSSAGIQNFCYRDVWGRCCGIARVLRSARSSRCAPPLAERAVLALCRACVPVRVHGSRSNAG